MKYQLRERDGIIYASAGEKVKHIHKAGDVDRGRAWRAVRRASDMVSFSFVGTIIFILIAMV